MKTCTFIIWISVLVLFPQGLYSKSLTNREQYNSDSDNSNSNERRNEAEVDVRDEAAIRDFFNPKHKHNHKEAGHLLRFHRSDGEMKKDDAKALQCAVMYKDNEPVGILQPFKESYRFLPVNGEATLVDINPVPVKRKTIMDVIYPKNDNEDYKEENSEINSQFTDDRYPSIFAKFKIDSRLDKSLNPDLNMKRSMYKRDTDKPDMSDKQVSSLKTTLSKMKDDNSAVVEEKLKNILDDMGLIDDYDEKEDSKREVSEDENLEEGTNKINLIKEEHNDTRNKRGEEGQGEVPSAAPSEPTTAIDPSEANVKEERTEEMESIDLFKDGDAKVKDSEKVNLGVSTEPEEARKRRQNEESEVKKEGIKEEKRDITDTLPDLNSSQLVKESELSQYEKRVEREIRDKIQKLKEEVKQEIMSLRDSSTKTTINESDTKRRKRQVVNTLIDEETQDIDPNLSVEEGLKEHHVRRKRGLLFDDASVIGRDEIAKNKVELLHINNESEQNTNNTKHLQNINKKSEDIDLSLKGKQKIDAQSDELRCVVNLGDTNPDLKGARMKDKRIDSTDANSSRKTKSNTHKTADVVHFSNHHSLNNKNFQFQPNISDYKTIENSTDDKLQSLKSNKAHFQNDNIHNGQKIMKNTHGKRHHLKKLKINKICCTDTSCSTCLEKRERPTRSGFQKIKTRGNSSRILYRPSTLKLTDLPTEIKKKKDIIDILNVIEKKKYNTNDTTGYNDKFKFGCTKCRKALTTNVKIKENTEESSHLSKMPESKTKLSPRTKTNVTNHAYSMKEVVNKTETVHGNSTSNVSDGKVSNTVKMQRFIGINPILQNATNSSRYLNRKLKQADEDADNENLGLYDEKVVQDIDDIANIKRPGENAVENLEKFNEDADETNPDTGIHIRLKRFGTKQNKGNYNSRMHPRKKRQARDDLEENVYQYNDSEFNEDSGVDNQSYYDEPFANDNVASINNNCNCDKTDGACKCGSQQKSGPSVPNIKEDYSEYEDGPSSNIVKKSVHNCHCDKNGKHCKCKTSSDASQCADYAEDQDQLTDAEKQSQDLYDVGAMGDLQAEQERAPRRPRQKSRQAEESVGNTVDEAEEYGDDYQTGSSKLTKREAGFKQLARNQPFQNGEYFVDLHPNIYRLTPVDNSREKRDSFKDLVGIHGGGPAMNHLVAVKRRSMLPHSRFRRRVQVDDNREPRQLIDMSDEDIFGALPQGFAGELARYKRVKRGKTKK